MESNYFYTKPDGLQATKPFPAGLSYGEKWQLWEEVNSNSVILEKQFNFLSGADKIIEFGFFFGLVLLVVALNMRKKES